MNIKTENLKLARMVLQADVNISEEELQDAIQQKLNPIKEPAFPRIIRRVEIPKILGISLREVDRLIRPKKVNNKILVRAQLPIVQIGKKAIGVLDSDLRNFIESRRSIAK